MTDSASRPFVAPSTRWSMEHDGIDSESTILPIGLRRTFASLRHPAYRIYFTGQFFSLIGTWMQSAALSWLVYELTGSKVMLGLVGLVSSVPMVLLSTWGGILADRYPRRTILLICQIALSIQAFALAILVLTQGIHIAHLMVLAGMLGIVSGIEMPARQAFVVEMVGRPDLMNAIALNASVFHAARILGPAVAGLLIGSLGAGWCFLANGISYGAIIAALLAMHLSVPPARKASGSAWSQASEGFRVVLRTPGVVALLALLLLVGIFGWSYVILMPAIARDDLGVGPEGYGLLMSAAGVGAVAGALLVAFLGEVKDGRAVVSGSVIMFALSIAVVSFTTNFTVALVALVPAGFSLTAFFSSTNTMIQSSVSDEVRGRVMGVYTLVFASMMPLGSLQAGSLAEILGSATTIRIGASVCTLAALAALKWMPRNMSRN